MATFAAKWKSSKTVSQLLKSIIVLDQIYKALKIVEIDLKCRTNEMLESQYDFEKCGNFTVSDITELDERCMRTHVLVPVITIAYLFYAFSWILFTLKAVLEQPSDTFVPASWHSDILSSSMEEIQGLSPPLDVTQHREIQKLQAG